MGGSPATDRGGRGLPPHAKSNGSVGECSYASPEYFPTSNTDVSGCNRLKRRGMLLLSVAFLCFPAALFLQGTRFGAHALGHTLWGIRFGERGSSQTAL